MLTKAQLKKQLKFLPEEFSIDELIERLILIHKVEKGEEQSKNNNVISETDLNKEIEKWYK